VWERKKKGERGGRKKGKGGPVVVVGEEEEEEEEVEVKSEEWGVEKGDIDGRRKMEGKEERIGV